MDEDIQKFFELFIGYNGVEWDVNHAKRYNQNIESYFLHDMEGMIKNQIGYPSLLYLLNTIAFLGFCVKLDTNWKIPEEPKERNDEFRRIGEKSDFEHFCNDYLRKYNIAYSKLANSLFDLIRHRLSHTFYTHNYITTLPNKKHLTIQNRGNCFYLWISVYYFFEDTKKAIEEIYEELKANVEKSNQFREKQKFILEWTWKWQEGLRNIDIEQKGKIDRPGPYLDSEGQSKGVSGIYYTPPQMPPAQ